MKHEYHIGAGSKFHRGQRVIIKGSVNTVYSKENYIGKVVTIKSSYRYFYNIFEDNTKATPDGFLWYEDEFLPIYNCIFANDCLREELK